MILCSAFNDRVRMRGGDELTLEALSLRFAMLIAFHLPLSGAPSDPPKKLLRTLLRRPLMNAPASVASDERDHF
jgi:hypothetical protein